VTGDAPCDELRGKLLDWMREPDPRADDARFDALALDVFAYQFERCAPYRRFCEGRSRTPASVERAQEIPAVPTGAFKELALRSFPAERECHAFRTSGTSGTGGLARGTLHLDTLALYEASLVVPFERHLLPEVVGSDARARILVLGPTRAEVPDSSLAHMFGHMLERRGDEHSGCFVSDGALDAPALRRALDARLADATPLLLCGTAFAFVHWLEALAGERLALPAGTRVMETGGFKGRARERPQEALYAQIEHALGVPTDRIVDQYGMTELASQFYDSVLGDEGPRRKLGPPWARVSLVDPDSGAPVPDPEPGALRVLDLANLPAVAHIQTADLGHRVGDGFAVLGREPGAEARGCSIAADEMLGG
jgi:hypothetical protein